MHSVRKTGQPYPIIELFTTGKSVYIDEGNDSAEKVCMVRKNHLRLMVEPSFGKNYY